VLRTHIVRSDLRTVSMARSSSEAVWTNTKDASPTAVLVPMPMLMFDLKGAGSAIFSGSMSVQSPLRNSSQAPPAASRNDWGTGTVAVVEEEPSNEPLVAAPAAPDVSEEPEALEPGPPTLVETLGVNGQQPMALEREPRPAVEAHHIELIIDSLPRRELIESIPVTVDSLGDQVFTATVSPLNVTGTGNTLGDALIIVKEQIEVLYERLSKATALDNDEKTHLTYLQSHIKNTPTDTPRASKRSIWR
jgi:hypothetical protein